MDESESSFSYCPDFSDMCSEDSTFWDFLRNENTITPSERDSNISFNYVKDDESPFDTSYERNNNELQEHSNLRQSVSKLDDKNESFKAVESDQVESNKSGSDRAVLRFPCSEWVLENVSNEDEDEFWDFLKSDHITSVHGNTRHNHKVLSLAEFEEIRHLSSLTSVSKNETSTCVSGLKKLTDSSTTADAENFQYIHSTPAEICRDLNLFKSEISPVPEVERNCSQQSSVSIEQCTSSEIYNNNVLYSNSTIAEHSVVLSAQNVNSFKTKRRKQFDNLQGQFNKDFESRRTVHQEKITNKGNDNVQTSHLDQSVTQTYSKGDKLGDPNKNLDKLSTSNSNVFGHSQIEVNPLGYKMFSSNASNLIVGTKPSSQMIPEKSNSLNTASKFGEKENPNIPLPIISSISSNSNIFCQEKVSVDKQNIIELNEFNVNNTVQSSMSVSTSYQNLLVSQNKDSSSFRSDSVLEPNSTFCSIRNSSPQNQKNVKRLLPRNSPKNSMFRIIDNETIAGDSQYAAKSLTTVINPKRQKTNNVLNDFHTIDKNPSSLGKDQQGSAVPVKHIVIPASFSGSNNSSVSNPTPLYLIIPKTTHPGQNQNAELLMVINNTNMIANNSDVKTSINLTNCSVPLSLTSSIAGNQITNSGHQIIGDGIRHISIPAINVMSLQHNTEMSNASCNYLQPSLIYEPTAHEQVKLSLPTNVSANNILPKLSPNPIKAENMNFYSFPAAPPSSINDTILTPITIPTSVITNSNQQFYDKNQESNRLSLNAIPGIYTRNVLQSDQAIQSKPGVWFPLQQTRLGHQQKFKPLKSIALGKDKNAIQQISIPSKIEAEIVDCAYDSSVVSPNSDTLYMLKERTPQFTPDLNNKVQSLQKNLIVTEQPQSVYKFSNKSFDFVPCKRNSDAILVKRNLITNETEIMGKNKFLNVLPSSELPGKNALNLNKGLEPYSGNKMGVPVSNSNPDGRIFQMNSTDVPNSCATLPNETKTLPNTNTVKNEDTGSKSFAANVAPSRTALSTLQELFPPPISMIPVCLVQTVQTANKPTFSKVLVLQSSNAIPCGNEAAKSKTQRKMPAKKTVPVKTKKQGRKTVKEMLLERQQQARGDETSQVYQPRVETKVLKPIYKLTSNGILVPTAVPIDNDQSSSIVRNGAIGRNASFVDNSSKRPNIMMLPSATKIVQGNVLRDDGAKKAFEVNDYSQALEDSHGIFDIPPDFLFDKMIASKDFRARTYDMCELCIGYFKVEDDVDSFGRFRSKFKVLFTKRLFLYDFPIMKCNKVHHISGEQMACIRVPFQTVVAMNMNNRHIKIQVNSCPQICLKKIQERSSLMPNGNDISTDEALWIDAVQNSSLHKITLRKRQADNLKTYLCQFDHKFVLLFNVGSNIDNAPNLDTSIFEGKLSSANLKKIYQKNKRNKIRRLPQWDSEDVCETLELMEDDNMVSSNHACSCRISCKSLRCSCVKAAKRCSTGGTVCLCINCDNPLNILDSYGMNLDFSLSDCCLFQNIYQIPTLRNFLQRDVKLSCCNTVARVVDCIPGTILCPNTECNACLEFSWCRGIICYPERNPRNHCSFCGQCCFSNRRHCEICNRCYIVTPKCLDCPNCRGSGFPVKPIGQEMDLKDSESMTQPLIEPFPTKSSSKPEIIVLDSSFSARTENCPAKKEIVSPKPDESHLNKSNRPMDERKNLVKKEYNNLAAMVEAAIKQHENSLEKSKVYENSHGNNINDNSALVSKPLECIETDSKIELKSKDQQGEGTKDEADSHSFENSQQPLEIIYEGTNGSGTSKRSPLKEKDPECC